MLASLATIMKEKTALVTSMVYFALTCFLEINLNVYQLSRKYCPQSMPHIVRKNA